MSLDWLAGDTRHPVGDVTLRLLNPFTRVAYAPLGWWIPTSSRSPALTGTGAANASNTQPDPDAAVETSASFTPLRHSVAVPGPVSAGVRYQRTPVTDPAQNTFTRCAVCTA